MGEFLVNLQETRPMLENFMSEFTRDIPTSNALFSKYNYGELESIFLDAIKEAINMDEKVTYERLIESDDLETINGLSHARRRIVVYLEVEMSLVVLSYWNQHFKV